MKNIYLIQEEISKKSVELNIEIDTEEITRRVEEFLKGLLNDLPIKLSKKI